MNAPAPDSRRPRRPTCADPGECARLDAFVAAHPDGAHLPPPAMEPGGRARLRPARAIIWSPSAAAPCVGCLPLTEIRSPLFGNALVSAGFGTGGGILADDEARRRGARPRPAGRWPAGSAARSSSCAAAPLPEGWTRQRRHLCQFRPRPARRRRGHCSPRSRAASAPRSAARASFDLESSARHRPPPSRRPLSASMPRASAISARRSSRARLFEAALDEFGDEADIVTRLEGRPPARRLAQLLLQADAASLIGAAAPREARALARQRPRLLRADAPRDRARLHPRRFRPLQDRHRRLAAQADLGVRRDAARLCGPHRRRRRAARRSTRSTPDTGSRSRPGRSCRSGLANRLGPPIARGLG